MKAGTLTCLLTARIRTAAGAAGCLTDRQETVDHSLQGGGAAYRRRTARVFAELPRLGVARLRPRDEIGGGKTGFKEMAADRR